MSIPKSRHNLQCRQENMPQAICSVNAGFGWSGGGSVEGTSLDNIGISAGGGRAGIGVGVQGSVGVSTTTTIMSPTFGEIQNWVQSWFY